MRCAKMQIFGSETSKTDSVLALYVGSLVSGAAAGSLIFQNKITTFIQIAVCGNAPVHPLAESAPNCGQEL